MKLMGRCIFLFCLLPFPGKIFGNQGPAGMNLLKKITVGPYDSYQGTLAGNNIFFTKKIDMQARIFTQRLSDERAIPVSDSYANAESPEPSPDGRYLAYTWFLKDARGDICIKALEAGGAGFNKVMRCLTSQDARHSSPFWFGNRSLGYLRQHKDGEQWELIRHETDTDEKTVLASGLITSPSVSPDGQWLAYYRFDQKEQASYLYFGPADAPHKVRRVSVDLPGKSGTGRFSSDGDFFFFSHYLNVLPEDRLVDVNENSTIFRISLSDLATDRPVQTWQITSSELNCHFPYTHQSLLYLTCAFEGSLDIYQMDPEGQIPSAWTPSQLQEAYEAARSYHQRLFILNRLLISAEGQYTGDLYERILGNFIQTGEALSALFYLNKLIFQAPKRPRLNQDYQLVSLWLKALARKKKEATFYPSPEFRNFVQKLRDQANTLKGDVFLKVAVLGNLSHLLGDTGAQKRLSHSLNLKKVTSPLAFHLVSRWLEDFWKDDEDSLDRLRTEAFMRRGFSQQSRLQAAWLWLNHLDNTLSPEAREAKIQPLRQELPEDDPVGKLLLSELHTIRLIGASDKKNASLAFAPLNALFQETKDQYHLRKSIYIRSIQAFSRHKKGEYMDLIASYWLRYTDTGAMEYGYASLQYLWSSLDRAYEVWSRKNYPLAASVFYQVLSQLDDLEAHAGYLNLMNKVLATPEKAEDTYQYLEGTGRLSSHSLAFREAFELLQEGNPQAKDLKKSMEILENTGFVNGVSDEIRYLLLGYANHQLFLNSLRDQKASQNFFQAAHRNYYLALDLGRDNQRVTAAVWANLGWLHSGAGNFGQASAFFRKRLNFPFLRPEEEASLKWQLSRSLYHSYRQSEAYEVLSSLLRRGLAFEPAIEERCGFYAMSAGRFEDAIRHYENFRQHKENLVQASQEKTALAYGYSLLKSGNPGKASDVLTEALGTTQGSSGNSRLSPSEIRHLSLTWGLLAKSAQTPADRARYKEARLNLLEKADGQFAAVGTTESLWLSDMSREYQQLGLIYEQTNQREKADQAFLKSLVFAKRGGDSDPTGPVIYKAVTNTLMFCLRNSLQESSALKREALSLASELSLRLEKENFPDEVRNNQRQKLNNLIMKLRGRSVAGNILTH